MIHILDGQNDEILDYITLDNVISDTHRKSLEDTLETYDVIVLGNKEYVEHLAKRNRIIIPDEDDTLRELIIYEVDRYRDSEGQKAHFYSHASYLELKKASIIYPNKFTGTASQHIGRNLNDTGWQAGIIEVAGNKTIEVESHTNPYEMLRKIAKEFGGELRFRIEHDGQRITGRYVDLLTRIGTWRGKEVTLGKDLDTIRRIEKQDIVTALLGLGPEKEDGTRLEVLVEDKDALQRWGRVDPVTGKLHHLIEPYEIQSERTEMTEKEARQYTRTALDKRINSQVTYETTIIDLADVAGLEHEEVFFGDTIRIKDTDFIPPLYLEARIFEMDRSLKQKAKKDIKLGDYIEYTEEEVNAIWEQLRKEIQDRLARMVIATVISSGGDVFKNGVGSTALTAKTFVAGNESDEDGVTYDYQWIKLDKNGEQVDGFIETGKTITVNANDIDEKATYRVLIAYGLDVVTTSEYTLTHLYDGQDGGEGRPGKDGKDGKSSYTHVRYSQNANGSGMTTNPVNAVYIGIAITESPTAPEDNTAYDWSKIKGDDGIGTPGEDGKTSYVHIKYSNDGGATFTGNNGENPGDYIGTYTDFTQADSNNVNDYTWAKVKGDKGEDGPQGIPGEKGEDGKTYYTWVKYANTPTSGMSDNPSGKDYIGFAYNKETPTMSTNYNDYTWSLYKGPQGVQGIKGADGQTTYTWVKYADTDTGGGMSDNPEGKLYIGLAFNKTTATESNNASDYSWSMMPQNITVGGRNLIRNSGNFTDVTGWSQGKVVEKDGYKAIEVESGTLNGAANGSTVEPDTYYVFSAWLMSSVDFDSSNIENRRPLHAQVEYDGSNTAGYASYTLLPKEYPSIIPANTWFKITALIKTREDNSAGDIEFRPFVYDNNGVFTTSKYWVRDFYLTKGEKQLEEWSPAPEDVDASIQAVQTTADGKNSIFRQNTQPSIAGRKVGDVWFKTNADNRMHVFNGTSWAQAGFGEQAIVADSITANHIKSLNGLNVNDQFIVDNSGNVEFGGELKGASGTFGEVTADADKFYYRDPLTGDKSLATAKGNLLVNHSFNFLVPDYSQSHTGGAIGVLDGGTSNVKVGWGVSQPVRMFHDAQPGIFGLVERLAMFGLKSVVVDEQGYLWQDIPAVPDTFYTYSVHIKRPKGYYSGGEIRIRVREYDSNNNVIATHDVESSAPTSLNEIKRVSNTFKTSPSVSFIRVYVRGTNERFVQVDGAQLVESEYMAPYMPDDEIAYIGHGLSRLEELFVTGGITAQELSQFRGLISTDPILAENFVASDGRFYGEGVGVLRVRNANIVSTRFYENTTSASTNLLRVASNGVVSRSTSSRRYKLSEKPIALDHAKKMLNVAAKTWFDKFFCETYAEALNQQDWTMLQENHGREKLKPIPGLIAEDLHDQGLYEFVEYDDKGRPDGISSYTWVLLLELIKDLYQQKESLKDDITDLIKRVEKLENAE